jgi:hypothetical protein
MRPILATTSAVALVASMSLALAQTPKGEQGQKEMSAPAMKEGGDKGAPKTGEKKDMPADKKDAQEKGAKDSPKAEKKATGKDEKKQATDKDKASKDTAKDEKRGKDASKEAVGKDGKADAKGGSGSVTLSQEQRTKVQGSFARHKGQSANVNITVNVGVAVPRTVVLRPIPQDIIVIVPAYRRYRYFVVGDKVCIVDPVTYQIVEIIIIA